jgi:hypothetical protein
MRKSYIKAKMLMVISIEPTSALLDLREYLVGFVLSGLSGSVRLLLGLSPLFPIAQEVYSHEVSDV